jgi:hypothetical protein
MRAARPQAVFNWDSEMTRGLSRITLRALCAGAAIAYLQFIPTAAQATGSSDGLADAERVLREAAAGDAQDAPHQRFAALVVLQAAARRVATQEGAKPTPDDITKAGSYARAMQRVMREVSQTGAPDCQGEDCPAAQLRRATSALLRDEAFVRSVFERFATPQWRATYLTAMMNRGSLATASAPSRPALPASLAATQPAPAGTVATAAAAPPRAGLAALAAAARQDGAASAGGLPRAFAFLAQMPTVERVLREVSGSDAVDTKVQQEATFLLLATDVMMAMRDGAPQVPARFNELDRYYKAEVLRLERELRAEVAPSHLPPAEQAQRWAPVFKRLWTYQASAPFRKQTLERFFAPNFVTSYRLRKGEFEALLPPSSHTAGGSAAAPVTLSSCDKGGCWTSDGSRMPQIANGVHVGPRGGLCTTIGGVMSCP